MRKKIAIFDLDDTLIFSEAKIKIYDAETNTLLHTLSPSQYNFYAQSNDHYMCFQDFECRKILGNSKLNTKRIRSLKGYLERGVEVAIVTARSNKKVVVDFFKAKNIGIKTLNIYTVCDPNTDFHGSISERKKQATIKLIEKGYNDIVFYDDNVENLKAVESLGNKKVSVKIIHVLDAEKAN